MKQTNNAIKFLMAQYRAIFKNANIAMVAAIAAAALASGQAQAAGPIEKFDNTALTADTTPEKAVVAGDGATDGQYKKLELTGGANRAESAKALEIKITAGDAHTIKGVAAGADATAQPAKPNVNLGNTALVIETATTAKLTIGEVGNPSGKPATPGAATNVTLGDITINKGELDLVAAADDEQLATTVNAANVTIGKGQGAGANDAVVKLAKHSSIAATALTVKEGAAVTVSGGASLTAGTVTVEKGTINLGTNQETAAAVFGSTTGKTQIKDGTVEVASGGKGDLNGAIEMAGGTLSNSGAMTVANAFKSTGGTIKNNAATNTITFKGGVTTGEKTVVNNAGSIVLEGGESTIALSGTSNIAADSSIVLNKNAVLNVSSEALTKLVTGNLKSSQGNSGTVVVTGASGVLDLSADDTILNGSGQDTKGTLNAKITGGKGSLTLKVGNAKFDSGDTITLNEGVTLAADTLALGATGDGAVTVKNGGISIASNLNTSATKDLKLEGGTTLTLAGSGNTLGVKSIAVGTADAGGSKATLNVDKGQWSVKSLTVTSGSANVNNSGTKLTITDSLTTTSADGKLAIDGATVDAKGVTTLSLGKSGASITNAGKLILSADKVVKAADSSLIDTVYSKNAVQGTTDAQISLLDESGNAISMTLEKFKKFREDTGFKGLFDIKLSDEPTTEPQMGLGVAGGVVAGVTNGYENVQGKVNSTNGVTDNFFIGNAVVEGGDTVALKDGGALSLSNAYANNAKGQYVTDKDGGVGKVNFEANNTLVLGGAGGKIGSVTAKTDESGSVTIADGANVEVVAGSFGTDANTALGTVNIKDGAQLNVKSGSVFTNDLNVGKGGYVFTSGDVVVKKTATIMGDVDATNLTLSGAGTADAKVQHAIAGGATIDADKLTLAANNTLTVGKDGKDTSSANVFVGTLDLAANSILVVDPEPSKPAALVVAEDLDGKKNDKDAGTLNGGAYVGMNSALGIGFTEAEFNDVMASYLVDGKFDQNGLKNALVLNKAVTIANGNGIVVNAGLKVADVQNQSPAANTLELESGAGLIITDNAFGADKSQPAITFASGAGSAAVPATVKAAEGAKISLVGDITAKDTGIKIFAAQGTGSTVTASGDLVVEAAGGLLTYTIANGSNLLTTPVTLQLDAEVEKQIRSLVSAPVGQMFVDYANGEFSGASGLGYDFVVNTLTAKKYGAIDAAAHAATYAGAQQAAVAAVTTMADAMFGRVGAVGVEAATISATGSQANGGVWLTPMYKSVDSDGFNAEGVSYGSDVDLAGVAFGTDTVNGNMRFGAVFNIGSGDAEGKGQGNGLKDEFDYYGFGIYSAMGFGNLALVGDASMTVISHDVEGLGLRGKADTTAVTMGITGQYTVATPTVDVTPHLGARFIRLNTDSYDLVGADGAIATTDFDVQNVFSVPLGVTLSKGFVTGGWTLAPSADLTVTFNAGDTEAKSTTTFSGIAHGINMNTEVLDEVQYGVTFGLGAQNGAFGTSFGINYTGSSNTDSFGVNAQARYMF